MPWDFIKRSIVRARRLREEELRYEKEKSRLYDPKDREDVLLHQRMMSHRRRNEKIVEKYPDYSCPRCKRITQTTSWILGVTEGMCRRCFHNGFEMRNGEFTEKIIPREEFQSWWSVQIRWKLDRKKLMKLMGELSITSLGFGYLQQKWIPQITKDQIGYPEVFHSRDIRYEIDGPKIKVARKSIPMSLSSFVEVTGWTKTYQSRLESGNVPSIAESQFQLLRKLI